eukprot:10402839-Lingulodinium_polyedra.AAC.1
MVQEQRSMTNVSWSMAHGTRSMTKSHSGVLGAMFHDKFLRPTFDDDQRAMTNTPRPMFP